MVVDDCGRHFVHQQVPRPYHLQVHIVIQYILLVLYLIGTAVHLQYTILTTHRIPIQSQYL